MKKKFLSIGLSVAIFISFMMSGCYSDNIDALSTFEFQLPVFFKSVHKEKAAPDYNTDFTNLNEYDEYKDNKEKISDAKFLHFNYRVDSLIFRDTETGEEIVFDKDVHKNIIFDTIRFSLQFAKHESGLYDHPDLDSTNWMPDGKEYLLGEFLDVNIADYYRTAHHIVKVGEDINSILSNAIKTKPSFYIKTVYSKVKGQTEDKRYFPYVDARYDLIIKLAVDL